MYEEHEQHQQCGEERKDSASQEEVWQEDVWQEDVWEAPQPGGAAWDGDVSYSVEGAARRTRIRGELGDVGELSGHQRWERHLTRRAKTMRVGGTVLGVTLALAVALVASGVKVWPLLRAALGDPAVPYAADEVAPTRIFIGAAPTPLAVAHWERLSLPVGRDERLADYQPSSGDPQSIFACVAPVDIDGLGFVRGPVTLWRTGDAGARWTTLALPPLTGSDCSIATASDAP